MFEKDTSEKVRELEKKVSESLKVINEMQKELDKAGIKFKSGGAMQGIRKSLQTKIINKLQDVLTEQTPQGKQSDDIL